MSEGLWIWLQVLVSRAGVPRPERRAVLNELVKAMKTSLKESSFSGSSVKKAQASAVRTLAWLGWGRR